MKGLPIIADVTFSTEAMAVVSLMVGGLISGITYVSGLLYFGKVKELASMEEERNSWRQMYFERSEQAYAILKQNREMSGNQFPAPLAAVVPESSSPPTEKQIATADIATERAKVTAMALEIKGWGSGP